MTKSPPSLNAVVKVLILVVVSCPCPATQSFGIVPHQQQQYQLPPPPHPLTTTTTTSKQRQRRATVFSTRDDEGSSRWSTRDDDDDPTALPFVSSRVTAASHSRASFLSILYGGAALLATSPNVVQANSGGDATAAERFATDDSMQTQPTRPNSVAMSSKLNKKEHLSSSTHSPPTTSSSSSSSLREHARRESLSGFFAGAALTLTKTIVKYPLDTATVRLQMPRSTYSIRKRPMELLENAYVGVTAPLVTNVPAGAVFFAVKDAVKTALSDTTSLGSFGTTLVSVAVAQIPYWILRNPTEVVKTRQQAGQAQYTATNTSGILQIYQQVRVDAMAAKQTHDQTTINDTSRLTTPTPTLTDGWDAYYTGYWENVLYAYPADVIKFACYEWLSQGSRTLPPATGALYGAVATAVAQCVTTPLDVVRNRVMTNNNRNTKFATTASASPSDSRNSTASSVLTSATTTTTPLSYTELLIQLARDEGLTGLFAGVTPRVGKAILSGAIQFATYEETKQEFAKLFSNEKQYR